MEITSVRDIESASEPIVGFFMEFGMAVSYKILQGTREYPENRRNDSHNFFRA